MKHTLIFSALAVVLAASPVTAQPIAADLLPAYEVATIVSSMGLRPVGRPAWMRGRYVVAAIDRHGREVNVVLDARDGQVLAVRPLDRRSFGEPRRGYRAAPYDPAPYGPNDPMDGRAPPPGPGAPPVDDDELFDNDQQQGSLRRQPAPARIAAPPRAPSVTGSATRGAPAVRRDAAPTPRPRPALAKVGDPGAPSANPDAKPAPSGAVVNKPDAANANDAKPDIKAEAKAEAKPEAKQAAAPKPAKPGQTNPAAATKSEAPKADVRVIDLSKPTDGAKPGAKPGEAIRF